MPDYLYELATEDENHNDGFVADLCKFVCISIIMSVFLFTAAAFIGGVV